MLKLLIIFLVCLILPYQLSFSLTDKEEFEKAHRLFWETSRSNENYLKARTIYLKLRSKDFTEVNFLIEYAYMLYYHTSYLKYFVSQKEYVAQYKDTLEESIQIVKSLKHQKLKLSGFYRDLLNITCGLSSSELAQNTSSISLTYLSRDCFQEGFDTHKQFLYHLFPISLGRLYFKVPHILFGDKYKTLKFLTIAKTSEPPLNYYYWYMAEYLIDDQKLNELNDSTKQKIIKLLRKGISLKFQIPEERFSKIEMQKLLQQLIET